MLELIRSIAMKISGINCNYLQMNYNHNCNSPVSVTIRYNRKLVHREGIVASTATKLGMLTGMGMKGVVLGVSLTPNSPTKEGDAQSF